MLDDLERRIEHTRAFTAGAAIAEGDAVKLGPGVGQVQPTSASDDDVIGIARAVSLQGAQVDIIIWGHVATARTAGPVAANAPVMPTGNGAVDDLDPDVVPRFGFALEAASQADELIEVLMVGGSSGVGGTAVVDPNYVDLTDPGTPVVGAAGDARLAYDGGLLVVSRDGAAYEAVQVAPKTAPSDYAVSVSSSSLQADLNALPQRLDADAYLMLPSGSFDPATVAGFTGVGIVNLVGAWAAATVATGAQSGTAGAGTNATTLVKPTGAINWTASNLVGKFLYLSSGGGSGPDPVHQPVLAPITANTTTTLSVESISGMDSTTVFAIVDLASVPNALLTVRDCMTPVVLWGVKLSTASLSLLLNTTRANVTLNSCHLGAAGSDVTARLARGDITLNRCLFTSGATVSVENAGAVVLSDCYGSAHAGVSVSDFKTFASTKYRSASSTGRALTLLRGDYASVEAQADSSGATPFYFEDVASGVASGSLKLAGANTATGVYGVQIEGSGRWILTGSTVTGERSSPVKDVLRGGTAELWSNLTGTTFGLAEGYAGSVQAVSTPNQSIKRGNYDFTGNVTVGGFFLSQGVFYQAFGLARFTATGTNIDDALKMESNGLRAGIIVGTTPPGTGVMAPTSTTIPGAEISVINKGANDLNFYPGKRTIGATTYIGSIDGASAGAPVVIPPGGKRVFRTLDTPLLNSACFDLETMSVYP